MGRDGKAKIQMKLIRKRKINDTKRWSRRWGSKGIRGTASGPHEAFALINNHHHHLRLFQTVVHRNSKKS